MIMKDKILKLRLLGLSINEIVSELGCAKSTVSYHINKVGLGGDNNDFLFGVDKEKIGKVVEMRNDYKTYDEILTEVDIPRDKLKKVCRKLGMIESAKNQKSRSLVKNDVVKIYNETKSKKKTAKILGVSFETIKNVLGDYKLTVIKKTPSESVISWRKKVKKKLVEYKGGCCEKCGYDKSIGALQFHHINPSEKDFTISGKSYSFERIKKEVDKCIMVCANCHIEIHEEINTILLNN